MYAIRSYYDHCQLHAGTEHLFFSGDFPGKDRHWRVRVINYRTGRYEPDRFVLMERLV